MKDSTYTQDHIQRENEFIDSELCIHLANRTTFDTDENRYFRPA